jgi:hypothetical protein
MAKDKRCQQEEIPDYGIHVVITKAEPPEPIYCYKCLKNPINQNDPLGFSGSLACEPCIRAYYSCEYRGLTCKPGYNESFESFVQGELKYRRREGARILKQSLKTQRQKGWGE